MSLTTRTAATAARARQYRVRGVTPRELHALLSLISSALFWSAAGAAAAQQRMAAEEKPLQAGRSPVPPLAPMVLEAPMAKKSAGKSPAPAPERAGAKARESSQPASKSKRQRAGSGGRQPSPIYQKLRDAWHAPVETVPTLDVTGRVPLVLSRVNGGDSVTLVPQREDGGFSDADLERAGRAFCSPDATRTHAIAPRLLDLVYRTMRHFEAPLVHIVSGYRADRAGSRHTQGRAVDMVLPGVSNEDLAAHVRQLGFVGVGIYPKSGFVHLDVRDRSYFWVDNSLPGERSRQSAILGDQALALDQAARARGEAPDTYVPNNEREDRAAARSYARRAMLRRLRAERQAEAQAGADAKRVVLAAEPSPPALAQ